MFHQRYSEHDEAIHETLGVQLLQLSEVAQLRRDGASELIGVEVPTTATTNE